MGKRTRSNPITIRTSDGEVKVVRAGHFYKTWRARQPDAVPDPLEKKEWKKDAPVSEKYWAGDDEPKSKRRR